MKGAPPNTGYFDAAANTLGTSEIRSLVKALMQEYPDMEKIIGERVSGAREGVASSPNVNPWATLQVRKPKPGTNND